MQTEVTRAQEELRFKDSNQRKGAIWVIGAAVVFLSLGVLAFLYRGFLLSVLDLVAEATGGRATALAALALGSLALVWALIWMLFPIFVYFGLRDLRRQTAALDRSTRLCAHRLAQLAAVQQESMPCLPPREKPPVTSSSGPQA